MGDFSKRADEVLGDDWREVLKEQTQRLRKHVPTSEDVATQRAKELLSALSNKAYMAGVMAHLSKRVREEQSPLAKPPMRTMPGREVAISLPEPKAAAASWFEPKLLSKEAGIFDFLTDPVLNKVEEMKARAAKKLDELRLSGMRTTTSPGTLPWFYPAAALTVPQQFSAGYGAADKALDEERKRRLNEEIEEARQDFERALSEEYGAKRASTAGELIDGLAQLHVKEAQGEINQALGAYLALAALLGTGTHEFARRWTEKRDPKRQEYKALREAVLRRMQARPPQVQISPPAHELEKTTPDIAA
jgi:hypothetical protein